MSRRCTVRAVAVGMLLLQLGWLVAVPPFRGMDEWDHAYRAAAVAEGQWRATPEAATRGTGALLDVPADIVAAAGDECDRLGYTGRDECEGTNQGDGTVRVASGAGRYHPIFYAVTGYPTLPFEGVSRLWAMRAVSALLCLGVFCLALGAVRRWATGPAAWVAMVTCLTPTVLYSSTVMAPNGIEMMAGLAVWSALIGLGLAADERSDSYYLGVLAVAGPVLVSVRSLGPFWMVLILLTSVLALPVSRDRMRMLVTRPLTLVGMGMVAVATAVSVGWALSQRSLEVGDSDGRLFSASERLTEATGQLPVWLLQVIGAFPYRDQPAPSWVYACWLLIGGGVMLAGVRRSSGRLRCAILLGLLVSALVPFVVTFLTLNSYGTAWQGRYGLPYALGLLLLAGMGWDGVATQSGTPSMVGPRLWVPGLVLYVVGQLLSPVAVLRDEASSPSAGTGAWPAPHPGLLGVAVALGAAVAWMAVLRPVSPARPASGAE